MTPDIDALRALLARVEGAKGADRILGIDLLATLCPDDYARGNSPGDDDPVFLLACMGASGFHVIDDIDPTSSLDATAALVERALPGWAWSCGTCVVSDDGWVKPDVEGPDADLCDLFDDGFFGDAKGGNVPLSLLDAMIQGLIARATVRAGLPFKSHIEMRREAMEGTRHEQAHGTSEAAKGDGGHQARESRGAKAPASGRTDGTDPLKGDAGEGGGEVNPLAEPARASRDELGVIAQAEAPAAR
jgi:hypothetical protein